MLAAARHFLVSLKTPGLVLVAVSGGSDSTGLLLALRQVLAEGHHSGLSLAACTVDHALRSDSAHEAEEVAKLCHRYGIPHITRRWEGDKPQSGLQAAARAKRYALLAEVARDIGATCLVIAHTCEDQSETVAMRGKRSADEDSPGLAGMADAVLYGRRIWIMRPFLALHRAEIRSYLTVLGETWFDDPSNASRRFERVRVRQDSAGIVGNTVDAAHRREWMSEQAAAFLANHARVVGGLVGRIDAPETIRADAPAVMRAVVSLASVLGGQSYVMARESAARLDAFLKSGLPGRFAAGRVVFDLRRDGLYLYREARDLPECTLMPGHSVDWDGRFRVFNPGQGAMRIAGGGADSTAVELISAGIPPGVAKRAMKSAPCITAGDGATEFDDAPTSTIPARGLQPLIPLYDTFLPRFDLMMADQIATLMGRDRYLPLPVHDVFTEKTGWA